jgi:hypothetical protein
MPSHKPSGPMPGRPQPAPRATRSAEPSGTQRAEDARARAKEARTSELMAAEHRRRAELEKQGYCF